MNDIQESIYNKNHVALLLLDSSSAFDTVDQDILLNKLKYTFKIGNNSLGMIQSYLKDRSFSVSCNNTVSKSKNLNTGVPQGSLLGPLMYILYTKDLENIAHSFEMKINTYADDIQLFISFSLCDTQHSIDKMTNCLNKIKEWMDTNYLKINTGKTQLKLFNPCLENIPFQLNFDNNTIDPIDEINILGVRLKKNLDLSAFIGRKVRSCHLQLRNLYHIRQSIPFNVRVTLVVSTIISQLDYCNSILAGATGTTIRPLELILNRGIRFIFGINKFTHITPYLARLHILPIRFRISYKLNQIAHNMFYRMTPQYMACHFSKFKKTHNINLREEVGRDKFMFAEKGPVTRTATIFDKIKKEWNALPITLRRTTDENLFKKSLKTHLFKKAFPEHTKEVEMK